jgi:hypothetical protein
MKIYKDIIKARREKTAEVPNLALRVFCKNILVKLGIPSRKHSDETEKFIALCNHIKSTNKPVEFTLKSEQVEVLKKLILKTD